MGRECSRVEDPCSDAHINYSAPLTHRPRNRMDTDRGRERGRGGGEGGRREAPSKRTLATKTSIVLASMPPLVTSLCHEI